MANIILKKKWEHICNEYVSLFCNKHKYQCESNGWIAGQIGTVINIADMFINLDDIRYDVDNDIPEHKFEKWYWKSVEVYELTGNHYMNYHSYCQGAPDYYTPEKLKEIKEAKKRVQEAKDALQKCIDELNN